MRVGLVRKVGLGAIALVAVGMAGCDDNPLVFDNGVAVLITTNPSVMTIPAGLTTLLQSRTVDEGNRPTWDDIAFALDATCGGASAIVATAASYEPEVQPPGVFDVTGGNTIGTTCITLTGGGVTASVAVTVVGDSLEILGASPSMVVFTTQQLSAALLADDGSTLAPFDPLTDITWSTDNAAVATVDATGLVTGTGAGTAVITASWSFAGVTVTAETAIAVEVPAPVLTSLDVASASFLFGEVVTITGTGMIPGPHAIFVDGFEVIAFMSPTVTDATTASFQMPPGADGSVDVQVGSLAGGLSNVLTVDRTGTSDPTDDDPATPTVVGATPVSVWGTVDGVDVDDFFQFTAPGGDLNTGISWVGGSGDLDLLHDDLGLPFNFPCGFPTATAAVPEAGVCNLAAGDYLLWVNSYDHGDATYNAFIAP